MKDIIKISTVNFKGVWGDKEANLSRIIGYIEAAASEGANLVVFPEMALTSYDDVADTPREEKMQVVQAETIPGPSSLAVAEVTKKLGIYAVFGMPERDADDPTKVYNAACVCGPEGVIGSHRKLHLPFPEMFWAVPGDYPFVFETEWGPMGISICYETYCFPELSRFYAAKGCRVHINPTAYAKCHGEFVSRASVEYNAANNGIYVVSANLVGQDLENYFWGGASIVGPCSDFLERKYYAGYPFTDPAGMQPGMYSATVDLSIKSWDEFGPNDLMGGRPDFRPDMYKRMMEEILENPLYQS